MLNFDSVGKNENLTTSFFNITVNRISSMRKHNLFVRLPCKVGSTVYLIGSIKSDKHWEKKVISGKIDRFIIGDLGVPLADICADDNVWYYACAYPKLLAKAPEDDMLCFEKLGIDKIFIDESQVYKNLDSLFGH